MEDVFALFDSHLFIFVLFCFLFIVSLQAQERGEVLRGAADEVPLLQLWALLQSEEGLSRGAVRHVWRQALQHQPSTSKRSLGAKIQWK